MINIFRFGLKNFGRIFGVISFIAGIVGILQYLMYFIIVDYLSGSYLLFNILQLLSLFPTFAFLGNLLYKKYKSRQEYSRLKEDDSKSTGYGVEGSIAN